MGLFNLSYPYAWAFCSFATLGAWIYGYDGVYFTGVSALDIFADHFGTMQPDGTYAITASSLSTMTSMINVGELVGSLLSAPINDRFGRKGGWLVGATLITAGVVIQLVTSSNTGVIAGGRAVLGLGVGVFAATSPLYIADVAPTSIRGPLLMSWQFTLSVSQIVAAGINQGVSTTYSTFAWRFPTGFQLLFPALIFGCIWFIPESPRWLVRHGKDDQARRSIKRVYAHDRDYDPEPEIARIRTVMEAEAESATESSWLSLIRNPVERRKVIYSAGALIAQQINGIQWFYYFGTTFARSIGLTNPFLMTLIVFIIQLCVVGIALVVANRVPRRPLLLTCTLIMMLSIFIVGCMGINADSNFVPSANGKVMFSFIIIEIVAFNFSWGPLGWAIASEMAVGPNRNKIYAISVACFWISVWVTVFTLPYLYYSANLGPKTGFIYTGTCLISLAYVYFCVGEVTGRSMEEIEEFFQQRVPVKKWKHYNLDNRTAQDNGDDQKFTEQSASQNVEYGFEMTAQSDIEGHPMSGQERVAKQ